MNEAEIYTLIVSGDLPKATCVSIIRSYGNRKAMEALEQARKTIPNSARSIDETEMEIRLVACIEMLDQFLESSIDGMRQGAG